MVDLVCVFTGFEDLRKYSEGVLAYLSVGGQRWGTACSFHKFNGIYLNMMKRYARLSVHIPSVMPQRNKLNQI